MLPQKVGLSSIAGKYERNRYKFKFPKAPASASRAQALSSGAMHDSIYGPICGSIHHHGIQNSGGPPLFWRRPGGCCHIWDHISYHAWHQNLTVAPALRSPELEETWICNGCARTFLQWSFWSFWKSSIAECGRNHIKLMKIS